MSKCQGCGGPTPHAVVYARCECREWPLAVPEAHFRLGKCGYCSTVPQPPFTSERS